MRALDALRSFMIEAYTEKPSLTRCQPRLRVQPVELTMPGKRAISLFHACVKPVPVSWVYDKILPASRVY